MNPATLPRSHNRSLGPLRTVSPTPLLGKVNAVLWEGILVIKVSLFLALVFALDSLIWLSSGTWDGIESLISSPRPGRSVPFAHRATLGGQITVNLLIVIAVITAAVGALAYEWYHAQAAKTHRPSLVAHPASCVAKPDATH